MGRPAEKFIVRAPRYVLRATDDKFLRFASEQEGSHIFTATFVNVSISGLAFIAPQEWAPRVGEIIKLEFPVPGGEQIAWWGTVVRTENYRPRRGWHIKKDFDISNDVYVAIHFENLPVGHRHNILEGLRTKAKIIARQRQQSLRNDIFQFIKEHFWQMVLFAGLSLLTFALLFVLSRPTANYDPDRGSPWGQRFKF